MADREQLQAMIEDIAEAKSRFAQGRVPDNLDDLLGRMAGAQLDFLREIPGAVRGLVEEGPLPDSYPMLAVRFELAQLSLQLHLMKPDRGQ